MTNLMFYIEDTVIIVALNGFDPIPRIEAYKKLMNLDQDTIKDYIETQKRYMNNHLTPIERRKMSKGLQILQEFLED